MNKELFVTYEIALKLKEKGFDELCTAKFNKKSFQLNSLGCGQNYNNGTFGANLISCPTYQQVFKWFREKHRYHTQIELDCTSKPKYVYAIYKLGDDVEESINAMYPRLYSDLYYTYENAEKDAVLEILKFIK